MRFRPRVIRACTRAELAVFRDKEADSERAGLLSDLMGSAHNHSGPKEVTAGVEHIIGDGGGTQTASVMRFMDATKVIHVGETVEWTTAEGVTSHTITFGTEPDPLNQIPPSANVTVDPDGARPSSVRPPMLCIPDSLPRHRKIVLVWHRHR